MPDPSRTPSSPPHRPRFRERVGNNLRTLSLVPREQRFYDLFEQQATILVSASVLLKEAFDDMGNLPARQREIKDLERLGDKNTYDTMRTLNETFVTPFDHEDISALAAGLDDILDYIEEIADTVNLYKIMAIPRPAIELVAYWRRRWCSSSRQSASSDQARRTANTLSRFTASRTSETRRRAARSPSSSRVSVTRSRSSS